MNSQEMSVVEAMETYGGGFVKCLAECFRHADSTNFHKLKTTFSEYWAEYEHVAQKWGKKKA
jgi:hypothetical protein